MRAAPRAVSRFVSGRKRSTSSRAAIPGDDRAVVAIRDLSSGATERLIGDALVAADGASSLVRGKLGLELEGRKELMDLVNCYFRADIERFLRERQRIGNLFFVSNDKARGVLQPLDAAGRWLCQINVSPKDWSLDVFTKERARDWVRGAVGLDDLDVEVLSLGLWQMNATVVERFVQGRTVLCGDAAHQFPPTGGLGVNTGLQGMHNAMWKLALCVKGLAGWPLVETYHAERRVVSQQITAQSLQNSANVGRIFAAAYGKGQSGLSAEEVLVTSRRYGNHLGVEFGAAYASAAVIPDGSSPPVVNDSYSDYIPSATPGCRAPHVWLGKPEATLSTLHLLGPAFTLLAAPQGASWCDLAGEAAAGLGAPLHIYRIGSPGLADLGGFADSYGLAQDGAVLVRPDGHVGWRSASGPRSGDELMSVLRQLLGR
jgi:putative polyketide hydroxylase